MIWIWIFWGGSLSKCSLLRCRINRGPKPAFLPCLVFSNKLLSSNLLSCPRVQNIDNHYPDKLSWVTENELHPKSEWNRILLRIMLVIEGGSILGTGSSTPHRDRLQLLGPYLWRVSVLSRRGNKNSGWACQTFSEYPREHARQFQICWTNIQWNSPLHGFSGFGCPSTIKKLKAASKVNDPLKEDDLYEPAPHWLGSFFSEFLLAGRIAIGDGRRGLASCEPLLPAPPCPRASPRILQEGRHRHFYEDLLPCTTVSLIFDCVG